MKGIFDPTFCKCPLKTGLLALLLAGLLIGCSARHQAPENQSETHLPTPVLGHEKPVPFGVFDIQGGHGHGQWKPSPRNLVR